MAKWIVAMVTLVALLGALMWKLSAESPKPVVSIPPKDAAATQVAPRERKPAAPAPRKRRRSKAGDQAEPDRETLDPQSEAFSSHLDVAIPDGFRARLARCEREGVDPDAKITITYQLYIKDGVVSTSDVRVTDSDLGNQALEDCMVAAVDQARWQAPELPDFSEEQDLFLRIRSLNKYLSKEEQEEAKARDRRRNE